MYENYRENLCNRVILNEVKNLETLSCCTQILRDAQDDTSGDKKSGCHQMTSTNTVYV